MNKKDVVLITGCGRGLGRALANVFAEHGATIVLHVRRASDLEALRAEIGKKAIAHAISGDLLKDATLTQINKALRKFKVNTIINNAALPCPHLPLEDISDREIEKILSTNLLTAIKLAKKAYSFFKQRTGTIININSLSGLVSQEKRSVYCASKWGLRGFTESLRIEAGKDHVRVMGIYPSRIMTQSKDSFGMPAREVAEKTYDAYKGLKVNDLILDNRPKKLRTKP